MICPFCNFEYDNSIDPDCPKCNRKNISVSINATIDVEVDLSYRGKSNEKVNKRPSFEFKGGNELNHRLNRKVDRTYHIDRVNDRYTENVTDKVTHELIQTVDEPLSKHLNHGDAKKKK